MANNPNRLRARITLPPAGLKLARKVLVTQTIRLNNKFFANPNLTNPAGGPEAVGPGGGGGGSS